MLKVFAVIFMAAVPAIFAACTSDTECIARCRNHGDQYRDAKCVQFSIFGKYCACHEFNNQCRNETAHVVVDPTPCRSNDDCTDRCANYSGFACVGDEQTLRPNNICNCYIHEEKCGLEPNGLQLILNVETDAV